jgi:acetylglutamate kinase
VDPSDVILRFLEGVGRRSEAEFYLGLFRAESKESFATLVVEAAILRHAFEAVVLDLRFLAGLGLTPAVVLGLWSPGAATLDNALRLRRRLERVEVPSEMMPADAPNLAHTAATTARAGRIPIVAFGNAQSGDLAARFEALGALACGLRSRKLIFIGRRGGLRPSRADTDLPIVNLATDYDNLVATRALPPKQLYLLAQARRILRERAQPRMLVAVTSPLQLLRELFTVKGAGTLVKLGASITAYDRYESVDLERLRALLAGSFGRPLAGDFFGDPIARLYLEEGYRGAAIVRTTPLGAYLTKFAVEREAQGEGIGRDLWQLMTRDFPTLFWRARPHNPIGPFYLQECDGTSRHSTWHVFWRGLEPATIPQAIEYALAQPQDFPES